MDGENGENGETEDGGCTLTGDDCAPIEGGKNFRVKVYRQLLLSHDLVIPGNNSFIDPCSKW